jgi:glycosyltransferase involved in cell wall biosynthesis
MKKKKILVLSDHPLSPSGVGTQTKYMIEALLKTGRYQFICLGGALKHHSYEMQLVEPWGEDFKILPIDGYGNAEMIRSLLQRDKPDALWFMTDPRFYEWLWEIENEVRANIPLIYYHVWDNFPAPHFNKPFYESNDKIVCISKVTKAIVDEVTQDVETEYLPHAVNGTFYKKYKDAEDIARAVEVRKNITVDSAAPHIANPNKKVFFWNNRNARRKQSGTLIWWFKEFLDEVGHDKATLLMHTDPRDPHGQDLPHIIEHLKIGDGQVLLSNQKVDMQHLANVYNAADYTISISDAEGFGLSTLESLACGTPIIVSMTGGLQEQVTDGVQWFGRGIKIASASIIGSLQVPYIYEDRVSKEDTIDALKWALNVRPKIYKKMSQNGIRHVKNNYHFETYEKEWIRIMDDLLEKHGSWETRKGYERWHLLEVA